MKSNKTTPAKHEIKQNNLKKTHEQNNTNKHEIKQNNLKKTHMNKTTPT